MLTTRRGAPAGAPAGADRVLARRLLIAAVLALAAVAACYVLMVRTSLGQRFDHAAAIGAQQQNRSAAATDQTVLQQITWYSFAVVLVVIVAIGAFRRRLLLGLAAAVAAGGAVLLTELLKEVVLNRPYLTLQVPPTPNTFPSGHTATAVGSALALVLVCPPRWKGIAAVLAGAYGWVTAAQVQTAGWHRPSDAIGGALVAFAVVGTVGALLAWYRPVSTAPATRHGLAYVVLGAVGLSTAGLTVVGLDRGIGYLRLHGLYGAAGANTRNAAYATGISLTVTVVVALLIVLLATVGRIDLGAAQGSAATARAQR